MSHTQDVETLLGGLVPFAEKMLDEHREFFPFGGHINASGEMALDSAHTGNERPKSQELIDMLLSSFRQRAASHELRACAVVYDIRTVPPGKSEKQDAICVSVDHLSGYSAHIVYPYRFGPSGGLAMDDAYALRGDATVFPQANG